MINTMGQFFSLPKFEPIKLPTPPSASIDTMSVYQPFPLRVDSFGEQGKQYDACFQIGEFPGKKVTGTGIVILIPLKVDQNPGVGGQFVNAFANKIPNILGAQPDPLQGYPDVPAHTGATWDVSKVVDVSRPYYTWQQGDGTRVIVMAEPILIAQADMTNIQRLPVTPPEDVIHEIGTPILYKPAPPRDANGKPVPCPQTATQKATMNVSQPPVVVNKPNVDSNLLLEVLLGIIGTLAIVIGVWFGVKLAAGPVGDGLRKIGDSIGSSLAGGYGAVKKATANTLALGPTTSKPFPKPRTPSPKAEEPVTFVPNPLGESKDQFKDRMRRTSPPPSPKAAPVARRPKGLQLRTPPSSPPQRSVRNDFTVTPTGESKDQFVERMKRSSPPSSPRSARRTIGGPDDNGAGTGLFGGKRKKKRRNRMKTGRKV